MRVNKREAAWVSKFACLLCVFLTHHGILCRHVVFVECLIPRCGGLVELVRPPHQEGNDPENGRLQEQDGKRSNKAKH